MPTINKVIKEFVNFGDYVDENGPRMTKNAFEKLSITEKDVIRKVVSLLFQIFLNALKFSL